MNVSIRKKLLLAFTAVTFVPIPVLIVVASWHSRTARAALDRRFVEDAARACRGTRDPLELLAQTAPQSDFAEGLRSFDTALRTRSAPNRFRSRARRR